LVLKFFGSLGKGVKEILLLREEKTSWLIFKVRNWGLGGRGKVLI